MNESAQKENGIVVRLKRESSRYDSYTIPYTEGMNILSVLNYIYENLDRTISYPTCLCRIGKCGVCAVRLNGKNVLACATKVNSGDHLTIEPVNNAKVIKDLVVG